MQVAAFPPEAPPAAFPKVLHGRQRRCFPTADPILFPAFPKGMQGRGETCRGKPATLQPAKGKPPTMQPLLGIQKDQ
jgi:hypothetical protein